MEKSEESGVKKGPWTPEEDEKLVDCIKKHGHRNWKELANLAGLNRCGKSCRLRWNNYLRPDIKRGSFSDQEQSLIIDLHSKLGNKWSVIASYMPGRTDNEIKNFWNTHLKKRLLLNGIDPVTHMPTTTTDHLNSFLPLILLGRANSTTSSGNFWENALRLQTDAAQAAKILLIGNIMQLLNSSTNPSRPLPMEAFNPNSQSANNNIPLQLEGLFNNPQPCLNNNVPHQPIFHGDYNYNDEIRNDVLTGNIEGNNSEFIKASSSSSSSFIYPDYRMPDLVSASPERLSRDNQTHYGTYPTDFSNPSSTSTTFEALGDLMDDEATNYYWKQILDRATLSP